MQTDEWLFVVCSVLLLSVSNVTVVSYISILKTQ